MKIKIFIICLGIMILFASPSWGASIQVSGGGTGGVLTDIDCNQAKYFTLGTLCQDTDDGKLYKGTGAAVVEIAAGSSGDMAKATYDANDDGDIDAAAIADLSATYQPKDADLTTYAGITPTANAQTILAETFAQMQASLSVDDLITLSGVAEGAANLGTFTGTTIPDSQTVKQSLQALETSVELKVVAGTVTNTKWCTGAAGNTVNCTEEPPAGTGDVLSAGDCVSGACLDGTSDGGTYADFYDGTAQKIRVGSNGVGKIKFSSVGNTNNETLTLDLETTANVAEITSATSIASVKFTSIGVEAASFTATRTDNPQSWTLYEATSQGNNYIQAAVPAGGLTDTRTVTIPDRSFTWDHITTNTSTDQTGVLKGDGSTIETFSFPWEKDIHVPGPLATDLVRIKAPRALTLTAIGCIVDPADAGESVVVDLQECDANGDNCVTSLSATITCGNTNTTGTLSDTAIDANDWMLIDLGTVTGTVSDLSIYIRGIQAP